MLTQSGVAHYLLSLGVVKPGAIVEGELSVLDASRRNAVFVAAATAGPAYVVKQARAQTVATLAHEAAVLRALATVPRLDGLIPEVVHEEAGCLVLRTRAGARDWSEHHRPGRSSPALARALARALAALHDLPPDGIDDLPAGTDRAWALALPEPPYDLLLDLSAAARDLVARVQGSAFVCARLAEVHAKLAADAVVHGDLRWDNCMVVAPAAGRRRTRVLLVDWELAGAGPAAFDVGTVFAEYLGKWVASIPMPDAGDVSRFAHVAGHPLPALQPAIQAFWLSYRAARARPPELADVVELAAVRLLQTAIEHARRTDELSAHAVATAQLAAHLWRDPRGTAVELLGLRE
jgi:aminoglycoside phosphotransferase (APT) family kinase protein